MDAIERWREAVAEEAQMETGVGAALVGLGVVSAAFVLLRRRRGLLAWAIPGALLAAGIVMLSDVLFDVRSERIEQTTESIESELAQLDPIARAQVLRKVGESQLQGLIPGRD